MTRTDEYRDVTGSGLLSSQKMSTKKLNFTNAHDCCHANCVENDS